MYATCFPKTALSKKSILGRKLRIVNKTVYPQTRKCVHAWARIDFLDVMSPGVMPRANKEMQKNCTGKIDMKWFTIFQVTIVRIGPSMVGRPHGPKQTFSGQYGPIWFTVTVIKMITRTCNLWN